MTIATVVLLVTGVHAAKLPTPAELFAYAAAKNLSALADAREGIERSKDEQLKRAYSVALVVADDRYIDQFIARFPQDDEGVTSLYEEIEMKHLTPRFLFSFEKLAELAPSRPMAARKLLGAYTHADGAAAAKICELTGTFFQRNVRKMLEAMQPLASSDRKSIYACLGLELGKRFNMERFLTASAIPRSLSGELLDYWEHERHSGQ